MISRHHLVEIKCVKELPLSTLSLPHHGLLPRIAVSVRRNHGSPTVSTRVLQHNREKADKQQASREVRFVPHKQTHPLQKRGVAMIYSITLSARRTSPAGISCPISFAA